MRLVIYKGDLSFNLDKNQIKKYCDLKETPVYFYKPNKMKILESNQPLPVIYFKETPPKLSYKYMAKSRKVFGKTEKATQVTIKDTAQGSLFY